MSLTLFKVVMGQSRREGLWERLAPLSSKRWLGGYSAKVLDDLFFEAVSALLVERFVECGANNAEASRLVSRKGVAALAIEANPVTFSRVTTVEADGYKAINVGLGKGADFLDFFVPSDNDTAGHATFSPSPGKEYSTVRVPVFPLDEVLRAEKFDTGRTALWIDVEGFQQKVLQGALETLSSDRCVLVKIEVENSLMFEGQILSEDVDSILSSFGFVAVFCDFEYEKQFNVVYVKKNELDVLAEVLDRSLRNFRRATMPLSFLLFDRSRLLGFGKRAVILLFGDSLGHRIAARFGSKSSLARTLAKKS